MLNTLYVVHRDGQTASAKDLAPLAFAGFAHFTAMQVRNGKVRALDLHLERLRRASLEMFGRALPAEKIRAYLRKAVRASPADHTLFATVYLPADEFTVAPESAEPSVLIKTFPAAEAPSGPLSLALVEYERFLPAVKHVGEVAKTYLLRRAVEQNRDDAAFIGRDGRLSEGTIWNLAFWDGDAVIWPEAELLAGTTMGIVRRQLDLLGVPQRLERVTSANLSGFAGCAVMNSLTPGVAVTAIGQASIPEAPVFLELLHEAYQAEPLVSA